MSTPISSPYLRPSAPLVDGQAFVRGPVVASMLKSQSLDGGEMEGPIGEPKEEEKPAYAYTESPRKRSIASDFRWWTDEYRCAVVCIAGLAVLSILLWHFDGKLAPDFGSGLQLDMVVIAIMTLVRVTLSSIVESCICQGAWIWFSKSHQVRTHRCAKLDDFKLFGKASCGLLGSLNLLWRLRGLHLSCIGAIIIIVTHSFETVSQQLFVYVQEPIVYMNEMNRPAPAPFRSDY
ncbi:hypothetical protein JDV02_009492 [Purpureocillium takamizusanense]|uniref:Uncharacterized protein n=1 Tax=Purpureocillium takamizusanense TaxID=2060973 RepID=A0A9Q8QRT1_9HYPO|nr:uncharacterized protein JDV02_009492 [Purpureocillium takamizusanense]UNI23686.1 hypothetical protein JDV02_009492 [Purpureocillium takamizusanense]